MNKGDIKEIRKCIKCEEDKPIEGFYKSYPLGSGLRGWCRSCCTAYRIQNQKQLRRAQSYISYAIRVGKIKRPTICHVCFKKCKPIAHHPDYNKRNLVQWICRSCHFHLHSNILIATI